MKISNFNFCNYQPNLIDSQHNKYLTNEIETKFIHNSALLIEL